MAEEQTKAESGMWRGLSHTFWDIVLATKNGYTKTQKSGDLGCGLAVDVGFSTDETTAGWGFSLTAGIAATTASVIMK